MNIFKKLFSRKRPPQIPRRTLPQRMNEAEENIEQLWMSLDSLASNMGGIADRLDKLEQEPPVQQHSDTPEFEFVALEPLEPIEEVSHDG